MSYEIIYDKQFIKLSNDRFIPIVLGGSNNCTELSPKGRERRARSWDNLNVGESRMSTLEQMITHANELRERLIVSNGERTDKTEDFDYYNDNRFGWYCGLQIGSSSYSNTSFQMYKNLFIYGCQNALTVEELAENWINVRVFSSPYSKNNLDAKGIQPFSEYFKTSSELETFIIEKEQLFKDNDIKANFYVTYSMGETALYWLRKKKRQANFVSKEPKGEIEITEAYVIQLENKSYFHKRTKNGFKYSSYSPKFWNTEKEVKAVMSRLKKDPYVMGFKPTYKLEKLPYKRNLKIY